MMIAGAMPPAAHMGDQAALEIAPLQFVEKGADQDRAGRADWMAERNRPAADILGGPTVRSCLAWCD